MTIDPTRYYSQSEIAPLIGLGTKAVTRECRRGTLRASRLTCRNYRIQGQAAIDFLQAREIAPAMKKRKKEA